MRNLFIYVISYIALQSTAHAGLNVCPRMPTAAAITHQWISAISASGVVTQTQPACGDLSNAAASCSTDTTNATNITTGTLGSTVQGNITTVGTVTSGTWNGTGIDVAHGGTGRASLTNHGVLVGASTSAITQLATGSAGQMLQSGGSSADPAYSTPTYPTGSGSAGVILRSDGTNNAYTTATYPNTASAGTLLAAGSSNSISATATPTLGVSASTAGTITLANATGAGNVTIATTSAASSWTLTLPSSGGSNGFALTTNGSGVTSWTSVLTNPATAAFDMFYQNSGNTAVTNLANGTTGQYLKATTSGAPSWVSFTTPSQTLLTSTGTQTGTRFTVSGVTTAPTNGATYTNNGHTWTVIQSSTDKTVIWASCSTCTTSGTTLTKSGGTGDSSITFSATASLASYTPPATAKALWVRVQAGGGGGGGVSTTTSSGAAAGGGGGGGYSEKFITTWDSTIYYEVGTGGGGATSGANNGTGGNPSSFVDSHFILFPQGGGAGTGFAAVTTGFPQYGGAGGGGGSGVGGGGSGGDLNVKGGAGDTPQLNNTGNVKGAYGGATPLAEISGYNLGGNGTGPTGIGYGGGGGGGTQVNNGGAQAGGAGANGVIIIQERFNGN